MQARLVGRRYVAECRGWSARDEVADELCGSVVVRSTQRKRAFFPVALEGNAGEWTARIVLGRDADNNCAVGIAFIARILAHAIGHEATGFGCGGDHSATRAHAETVDRSPVARVMDELVIGRAE